MITLHCQPPGEPASAILIGRGLLAQLAETVGDRRAFLFFDPALRAFANTCAWPQLEHREGERGKTLAHCETVLRAMVQAGLDRRSLLLALGGGVIGDLGGLAASLFMRGIEMWQLPTTLLAMVDSAVGGKTAVNLPEGKNLIGTVHPASRVLMDIDCLASLPELEYRSGLGEVVKMAIGFDGELFALLEREHVAVLQRDTDLLTVIVQRAVAAKIAIVEADPRELGVRARLNLGHTLGHALEAHSQHSMPHGLCVARGLHFAIRLAQQRAAMPSAAAERSQRLLATYGFACDPLPPADVLQPFLARDKKRVGDSVRFAMPTGVGSSDVCTITFVELMQALAGESPRQ